MFITKKKYEKALAEQRAAIDAEWERRMNEFQEREWRDRSRCDWEEQNRRRMDALEKRVYMLEKAAGLAEEIKQCPYAPKAPSCY